MSHNPRRRRLLELLVERSGQDDAVSLAEIRMMRERLPEDGQKVLVYEFDDLLGHGDIAYTDERTGVRLTDKGWTRVKTG